MSARGRCRECGFSFRLRKDGLVMQHHLWSGIHKFVCLGSRRKPSIYETRYEVFRARD